MTKNDWKSMVAYVVCGLSALLTLYVIIFLEPGYYHADCTDTIMWAGASYDAGKLVNQDFNYAAMMPFAGNVIMWPLIAIFGLGMKAQIGGMIIFFLLFLCAVYALCRQLSFDITEITLTVGFILFSLSASEKLREIFWGHIIYYSFGALLTMAILAAGFKLQKVVKQNQEKGKNIAKSTIIYGIIVILLTFISGVNGVQIASISSIPLAGAFFAYMFFEVKEKLLEKNFLSYYIVIGIVALGILLGIVSIKIFTGGVEAGYANAYSLFANMEDWTSNFIDIPMNLFTLMGVELKEKAALFSGDGIAIILRIITTIILFVTPISMLFQYKELEKAEYKIVLLTHHFVGVVILLGWTFGRLNAADWRLSPLVVTAVLCCMMKAKQLMERQEGKRLSAIILVPLLIVSMLTLFHCMKMEEQSSDNKQIAEVIKTLEDEDITYGYATFWNANIITMMSDSKVEARCVELKTEGVTPNYYQTNKNWYGKDGKKGKCFVLMTQTEYAEVVTEETVNYIDEKNCGDFRILIYEENIFNGENENALY